MSARITHFSLLLLYLILLDNVVPVKICRGGMGVLYPPTSNCYYLPSDRKTYINAASQCVSMNGHLVSILTQDEDEFLRNNITLPFWIGLSDSVTESEFRWEEGNRLLGSGDYTNWVTNWEQSNGVMVNCVNYNGDSKWHLQRCDFGYLPLCELPSCESNDGVYCVGEEPTSAPAPFNIIPIAAGGIIVVILVVVIVVVILLLFYLYKWQNDLWKRFCSCLSFSKTKQQVHGLEHENFRLRKELNNLKHQSLNLSGSQSISKPQVISSIPDGQGGMLPSIRPKYQPTNSGSFVAPQTLPVPPPSDPTKPGPPPLTQNTALLQSSLNFPSRTPNIIPTPIPQPTMNTSITSEQIAGILWQQSDQTQKKSSVNFPQPQIPSRSIFQSPFPTASLPFSFPVVGNQVTSPSSNVSQPVKNPAKPIQDEESRKEPKSIPKGEKEDLKTDTDVHAHNHTDAPEIVQ